MYFHDYKLAIEVDEIGRCDSIDYEIHRQKAIEKELGREFIRINPDKKDLNIFKATNRTLAYQEIIQEVFNRQEFKKTIRTGI